jgi:hypothetical protein
MPCCKPIISGRSRQARQRFAHAALRARVEGAHENEIRPFGADPIGEVGQDCLFRSVAGSKVAVDRTRDHVGKIDVEQPDMVGIADVREQRGVNRVAALAQPPEQRLPIGERTVGK